eukprot:10211923-Ditylum_brightwellii.AAC.2
MHCPPLEQVEDDDDNSTYVPDDSIQESEENDTNDTSIPSIDSLQDAPICHDDNNFEPLTNTTSTTHNVTDDNAFTAGVNMQQEEHEEEDESSSSSKEEEEGSEEEPSQMTGVQQDDHFHNPIEEVEEETMEDETLQAKIDEREAQINILPPTNESTNSPHSMEDQIAHTEQEMDQAYRMRIHGGLRTRKHRTLVPSKFQRFSNATTAKI